MVFFGIKKETKIGKGEVPTEKVKNFLSRGFTEIEIIDLLRKEGYSPQEIDMALLHATTELKKVQNQSQQAVQATQTQSLQQTKEESKEPIQQASSQPSSQLQTPSISAVEKSIEEKTEKQDVQIDYISLEEYIEYLLREKTQEINKRLIEINLRYKELEDKILNLRREIEEMSTKSREDTNKILNEIRISRDNVNELSIRVETLSKTLKELLPSLVESVRLLSEIVQKLKT